MLLQTVYERDRVIECAEQYSIIFGAYNVSVLLLDKGAAQLNVGAFAAADERQPFRNLVPQFKLNCVEHHL